MVSIPAAAAGLEQGCPDAEASARSRCRAGPPWRLGLPDRPHLDRPLPGVWDLGGDLEGLIEVGAFDQVVPADLFLCLGERAVADHHVTAADLHGGGGPGGPEAFTAADLHGGGGPGGPEAFTAADHAAPNHLFGEG